MTNIKLNINVDNDIEIDHDFFKWLNWLVGCIESNLLSIQDKGGGPVKGSETFTSEWVRAGYVMAKVEVNYERI